MTTATLQKVKKTPRAKGKPVLFALLLSYLLFLYLRWSEEADLWIKITASLAFPLGLLLISYLMLIGFARFLPPLDQRVGTRTDRTIVNSEGNYQSTFLTTGRESNGAYELIQVEVSPKGGNEWHYHKTFQEYFTVLAGQLTVGVAGKEITLIEGQSAVVEPGKLHFFRNDTDTVVTLQVRATPALGLEKSIRVAYGLVNSGQWEKDALFPRNPWHLFLLLGYSETYLPQLPGFLQEPLINALAKIAQWRGEDRDLKPFFQ